nr:MAG TPA: hypothetical protein [Caudoviricetes sp.]
MITSYSICIISMCVFKELIILLTIILLSRST